MGSLSLREERRKNYLEAIGLDKVKEIDLILYGSGRFYNLDSKIADKTKFVEVKGEKLSTEERRAKWKELSAKLPIKVVFNLSVPHLVNNDPTKKQPLVMQYDLQKAG